MLDDSPAERRRARRLWLAAVVLGACAPPATTFDGMAADKVRVDSPLIDSGVGPGADGGAGDGGVDAGVCLGISSPASGRCRCHADCPSGALCVTEEETHFPGGFCMQLCDPMVTPDAGLRCAPLLQGHALVPVCDVTNRCREGYVCLIETTTGIGRCEPRCSRDSQCPATGSCDLYSGLCQPEQPGAGLTAPCVRDSQCKSGACFPATGSTPAFCSSTCNTLDRVCPENGTCVAISSNPAYTSALCFLKCDAGTCATGFRCSSNNNCLPIL